MSLDWRVRDYRDYVAALVAWAKEVNHDPTELEYLMFRDAGSSDPTSQWSQPAFRDYGEGRPAAESPLSPEESSVLEALDDAVDAFAALPLSPSPSDTDDFEQAVRQLRRIVLARRSGHW